MFEIFVGKQDAVDATLMALAVYCFKYFVGKQDAVDATLMALEVIGEPLKSMASMLVDVCAYAGQFSDLSSVCTGCCYT